MEAILLMGSNQCLVLILFLMSSASTRASPLSRQAAKTFFEEFSYLEKLH
jgi:hypothetical protein